MKFSLNHKGDEMSALSDDTSTTRAYRSPLRDEQAAETRSRILDAAAELFATRGYGGTSLAKIGELAGVSPETVKASGLKRDLLLAAFEKSFAGMEGVSSLAAHGPVAEITADTDNTRYLAGIMHFVAESNRRSSRLWATLISAAASDAELEAKLHELQQRRRSDMLILVDELMNRDIASAGIARQTHTDTLSFILSPEGYNQLVLDAGWGQGDYEAWLVRSVMALSGPTQVGTEVT